MMNRTNMLRVPLSPKKGAPVRSAQLLRFPKIRARPVGTGVRLADNVFRYAMTVCALSVLAVVGLILFELILQSRLSLHTFGWRFFLGTNWDPVSGEFGAAPFIYGTVVSSLVALVISVPLAVGLAIFITEMCPRRL